jgi:hypothetical protein
LTDDGIVRTARALRERGHSPKQIARTLGLRPAAAARLVRDIAAQEAATAPAPAVVGCWVSPGWSVGLTVEGQPGWPEADNPGPGVEGLTTVVVARRHRFDRVSVCCYLVDVYCLGVKETIGPRVMSERDLTGFVRMCFAAYDAAPLAVPIDLAQHLVLGAVEYSRRLGFEPARDYPAARGHLGPRTGPSAIGFGRDGKPFYVQGPYDDGQRVMRTLQRTVGEGNFEFLVVADAGFGIPLAGVR